jgi:hypothetical protein
MYGILPLMTDENNIKQHIAASLLNYPGEPNIWATGKDSSGNTYGYRKIENEQHNVEFIINDGLIQKGIISRLEGHPCMM